MKSIIHKQLQIDLDNLIQDLQTLQNTIYHIDAYDLPERHDMELADITGKVGHSAQLISESSDVVSQVIQDV